MEVVEFFQDEVQFPYGVIKRVSAPVDTLFLFSSLVSFLFHAVLEKCAPHGDLSDILVSCN